jgi:hypothetical protein
MQEISLGEDSYFQLQKGQKLHYQLIPVKEAHENDSVVIRTS